MDKPYGPSLEIVEAWPIKLDAGRHEAYLDEKELTLTLSEFRILFTLIRLKGFALSRSKLLNAIDENCHVVDRNVDVHIASIRKKLGSFASMIKTVRGIGYKISQPSARLATG